VSRARIFWRLLPSYSAITLVAILAVSVYAFLTLRAFYLENTAADLAVRADLVIPQIRELLDGGPKLAGRCQALSRTTAARITVILPDGTVRCDSSADISTMGSHASRPEIRAALAGGHGQSVRFSHTVGKHMMYVARPIDADGEPLGVVRLAIPVTALQQALASGREQLVLATAFILLLAAATTYVTSRRLARPMEAIRAGAERIAQGDYRHTLPMPDVAELAALSEALNRMVAELDQQLLTVSRQRNELKCVLDGMTEGVVVVDTRARIFNINPAACRLLQVDCETVFGLTVIAATGHHALQRFVERVLDDESSLLADLVVDGGTERFLQASGTVLHEVPDHGERLARGAVIVLNDVTEVRRLEAIRRDFVANVSHELRTPITSIKGFAETLLEGGLEDTEHAHRFLGTMVRQADRLNAIIDDLLSLARIERLEEHDQLRLEHTGLESVVDAAVGVCRDRAAQHGVRVVKACRGDLSAWVNASLLEQALANLVDNAIKYSHSGGEVRISAQLSDGDLAISVRDQGIGIPAEHLPRLFERFYRVDASRSRELGGTGLGLAIVKHIIRAHGGRVSVHSEEGAGSTFTLHIPDRLVPAAAPAIPARA
jgi:two-component system phosphate regulon sensor histidine kinase PhoR